MSESRYWSSLAYGGALLLSATLGYFLLRIPIQTTDCFTNMLELDGSFMDVMRTGIQPGYLRPGLWAQLKVVYDLSQGEYFYWFRWTAAVQVLLVLVPFAGLVRPQTAVAALVFPLSLAVLVGHHAFAWTIREAFPVNAYLTNVIFCALAVNLAIGTHRWWKDVAAALIFIAAVSSVESGLLVGVIVIVGYALGMRGISRAGVLTVGALIAGYFVLRFVVLDTGTPTLFDREASFGFHRYGGGDLTRMFPGTRVYLFYAYNVVSALVGLLFAEPRDGMWRLTRSILQGHLDLPLIIGLLSSTTATILIGRYTWVRRHAWRRWELDRGDRIVMLSILVILANAAISFAYTKDVIMSPAGYFYAAAFFVACHDFLERFSTDAAGAHVRSMAPALGVAVMLLLSVTWTIRAVGLHAALTQTAYKVRQQWAYFDGYIERKYTPVPPKVRALKTHLQSDAVIVHPGTPEMREEWTPLFEMD
ncbi:MAG TPA: hypothetical protein VKB50_29080 [Vicinamibacterales bacterium]|nr:hypothetical protein [Vicinamibacterales bacterium]